MVGDKSKTHCPQIFAGWYTATSLKLPIAIELQDASGDYTSTVNCSFYLKSEKSGPETQTQTSK